MACSFVLYAVGKVNGFLFIERVRMYRCIMNLSRLGKAVLVFPPVFNYLSVRFLPQEEVEGGTEAAGFVFLLEESAELKLL